MTRVRHGTVRVRKGTARPHMVVIPTHRDEA